VKTDQNGSPGRYIPVSPSQIRDPSRPGHPVDAQLCPGKRLALEHGMAIMWDPPAERPSLEPTDAELAWKQWLMELLIAKNGDVDWATCREGDKPVAPSEKKLTPAA
jgi:hypothetical protein